MGILTGQSVLRRWTHRHKNLHKLSRENSPGVEPMSEIQSISLHFMGILGWMDNGATKHHWMGPKASPLPCAPIRDCCICRLSRGGRSVCVDNFGYFPMSIIHQTPQREWRTAIMCLTPNQQSKMECQPGKAISSQERDLKTHNLLSREYTIWNITWVDGINFDLIFFGDNNFRKPIYDKCPWDRLPRVQINGCEEKRGAAEF